MSLVLNESLVLAKTRSQDLKSVLKLNCWGSGIKDVSLVRQLVNVEVIGLSCNEITTLEDFAYCPKLRELILRKNKIKNISEVAHLQRLPKLTNLWLNENPCVENTHNYRKVVLKALPNLTVLDNIPVTREELQEIEELGNEIYEEVQYESSASSSSAGSGLSSSAAATCNNAANSTPNSGSNPTSSSLPSRQSSQCGSGGGVYDYDVTPHELPAVSNNSANDQYINETSYYQVTNELTNDISITTASGHLNQTTSESHFTNSMVMSGRNASSAAAAQNCSSRLSNAHQQPARCLSLQGSVTTLNGSIGGGNNNVQSHNQGVWANNNMNINNNNNNNSLLPKGGKSRSGNILSAVLCLVKELDYVSCEVVQTALHCRMEETSQ